MCQLEVVNRRAMRESWENFHQQIEDDASAKTGVFLWNFRRV
jgi:hypothetical protein